MTSKLTITRARLAELVAFKPLPGTDINSATRDEWMSMAAELQERRKADSEPVAWTWHHLKQWHVTNDEERVRDLVWDGVKVEPLYRHAQPAPVVPEEKPIPNTLSMYAVDAVAAIAEAKGWNACRAAMLQARSLTGINPAPALVSFPKTGEVLTTNSPAQSDCSPAQNHVSPALNPIDHGYRPDCECSGCKATARICAELAGNSPVIPDGYVMVPKEPTEEMLAAAKEWTGLTSTAEAVYIKMLAAVPQLPGSEPAAVPGAWIPVSERMPENDVSVLTFDGMYKRVHHAMYGHWQCWEPGKITHWMPLPAALQEVNHG